MNNFYMYIHRRATDNKVFYVGKGSDRRAWDFSGRNRFWKRVAEKHGVTVELVFENLSEEDAFQCEIDAILEFRYFGYPLTNILSGGEGASGLKFTDDQRLRIAESLRGRIPWNKGIKKSDDKEYAYSQEYRQKLSLAKIGVFPTKIILLRIKTSMTL